MADELDPVEQQFIADMAEYLDAIEDAVHDARDFADANLEAKEAVDGLRDSSAEVAAALDEDRDKEDEAAEAADRLRDKSLEAAEALGDLRDKLLETAGAADAARDGESAGGGFEGMGSMMQWAIGAAIIMLPTLGGLVTGLLAAGAGAGAFAALAYPAISQVTTELTNMATQTKAQTDAWDKMHPAAATIIGDLEGFKNEWTKVGTSVTPIVDKLLGQLLQIGTTVLPEIIPLARSFGTAFSGVLTDISKALAPATHTTFLEPLANGMQKVVTITQGGGFQSFLHTLTELQGPAMRGIGSVLSAAAGGLAKFTTAMAPQVPGAFAFLASAVRGLFSGLTELSVILAPLQAPLQHFLESVGHGIGTAVKEAAPDLEKLFGALGKLLTAVSPLIGPLATLTGSLIDLVVKAVIPVIDALTWLATAFSHSGRDMETLGNPIRGLDDTMQGLERTVEHVIESVLQYFGRLLSQAGSILGRLSSVLFSAGAHAIEGLLRGIESMAGAVLGEVSHLAGDISSAFSKVLGILSPSTVFHQHAVNTLQGYINGIREMGPQVRAALAGVGGAVGATGLAGIGGVAPGGGSATAPSVHVTVPLTIGAGAQAYSSPAFLQYINQVVQEATLRYSLVNPSNGLNLQGKLS